MPGSAAGRPGRAYTTDNDEPDVRARRARRHRLLAHVDDALEQARTNDPDWRAVSDVLSRERCELSRDLLDGRPGDDARWPGPDSCASTSPCDAFEVTGPRK